MYILTLNMRRQHTFGVYIGLRKLKLLFTYEIFAFYQFLVCFVNIVWKIREKKYSRGVNRFREDQSGYKPDCRVTNRKFL